MKTLAKLSCFILVLIGQIKAQDLIIKKDSTEIYCKIVYVNVKSLYYTMSNDPKEIKIEKSDVMRYTFDWNLKKVAPQVVIQNTVSSGEFIKLMLSAAVAIPTGDFASSDVNNNQSGIAMTGYMLNGGLGLKLHKHIRLMVSYLYQSHAFDVHSFDAGMEHIYPGAAVNTSGGSWIMNGLMGGLHVDLPIEDQKKVAAIIKMQMGIPNFTSPAIDSKIIYRGATGSTSIETAYAKSMAYLLGLGFSFKLAEEASLQVSTSLFGGKPTFYNVVSKNSSGYSSTDSFTQKINSINIQLGLVIKVD